MRRAVAALSLCTLVGLTPAWADSTRLQVTATILPRAACVATAASLQCRGNAPKVLYRVSRATADAPRPLAPASRRAAQPPGALPAEVVTIEF